MTCAVSLGAIVGDVSLLFSTAMCVNFYKFNSNSVSSNIRNSVYEVRYLNGRGRLPTLDA